MKNLLIIAMLGLAQIESRYPGHVVAVNKEITTPDGNVAADVLDDDWETC